MDNSNQTTPSVPSVPKANKSGPNLIILILLMLVAVGATGVFLYSSRNTTQSVPSSIPKTASSSAVQTPSTNNIKPSLASTIEIQSTASGQIKANLTIQNTSPQSIAELYYDIYLKTPQTLEKNTQVGQRLLAYQESSGFNLSPDEKKVISITLPYSPNIKAGKYTFQASVINKSGVNLSSSSQDTLLNGSDKFLDINQNSCQVFFNKLKHYPIYIGPTTNPGEIISGQCQVTNTFDQQITAQASLAYGVRFVTGYPQSPKLVINNQNKVTFLPHETKTVSFELPTSMAPQVYEAYAFLNDENGNTLSVITPFRWTIRGPSAYIQDASLDKNYYVKGDSAQVTILANPSMDLFWRYNNPSHQPDFKIGTDLKNARLTADIYSGQVKCGETVTNLPDTKAGGWGNFPIKVSVTTNCTDPEVRANISEGSTSLASFSQKFLSSYSVLQTPQTVEPILNSPTMNWAILVVAVVIIISIVLFTLKKQGMMILLVLPLIALLGSLSTNQVDASYNYSPDCTVTNNISGYSSGPASVPETGPICTADDIGHGSYEAWFWTLNSDILNSSGNSIALPTSNYLNSGSDWITVNFNGHIINHGGDNSGCWNFPAGFLIYNFIDGAAPSIEEGTLGRDGATTDPYLNPPTDNRHVTYHVKTTPLANGVHNLTIYFRIYAITQSCWDGPESNCTDPIADSSTSTLGKVTRQFRVGPPPPVSISGLTISNAQTPTNNFTSSTKATGNQSGPNAAGWYNPMVVTLNADANGTYKSYTAFYSGTAASESTFLTDMPSRIKADPKSGFLLRYDGPDSSGKYYVWDPNATSGTDCITGQGCFIDISNPNYQTIGYAITQGSTRLYRISPGNTRTRSFDPRTWTVGLDSSFGSKSVYTGAYVNSPGIQAAFSADINPPQLQILSSVSGNQQSIASQPTQQPAKSLLSTLLAMLGFSKF